MTNQGFSVNDFSDFCDNEEELHFCQHEYMDYDNPSEVDECGHPSDRKHDGKWLCPHHIDLYTHVVNLDDMEEL